MVKNIPNEKRYKKIIEIWKNGGLNKIKQYEDYDKFLYRLIFKYGKIFKKLYKISVGNNLNIGYELSIDLTATTKFDLTKNIDDTLANLDLFIINNAKGIDLSSFDFQDGNIYPKEVITFGKFIVVDKLMSKQFKNVYVLNFKTKITQAEFKNYDIKLSDLTDILMSLNKKIKSNTIDIDKLKEDYINFEKTI